MKHPDGTPYSDGKCDVCRNGDISNGEHLIFKCQNSYQIWKKIEVLMSYVNQKRVTIEMQQALTGFWQEGIGDETLLNNMVISITRYHLWKVRNSIKYDNKSIDLIGSSRILKSSLINHVDTLIYVYSHNIIVQQYLRSLKRGIVENNLL